MRTFTRPAERYAGRGRVTEHTYRTPWGVGRFVLAGDLPVELDLPDPDGAESTTAASTASARLGVLLERYFAGERVDFGLDVDAYAEARGLTTFERRVYAALARVPYGTALSYRELAAAAGHPNAYRAAGSAMARNALPVVLPCHRVVRNDGRLGQYGSDPAWKERLLALEGVAVREGRLA
jgi:methylated-DNA-[protein]-cysteine S-methyltransferase